MKQDGRKRSSNSKNMVSEDKSRARSSTPDSYKPWAKNNKVTLTLEQLDEGETEPLRVQKARRKIDEVVHNEILRKPKNSPAKDGNEDSSSGPESKPRRGRKRERDDKYFVNAVQKI